jgi:hypothetical protein
MIDRGPPIKDTILVGQQVCSALHGRKTLVVFVEGIVARVQVKGVAWPVAMGPALVLVHGRLRVKQERGTFVTAPWTLIMLP